MVSLTWSYTTNVQPSPSSLVCSQNLLLPSPNVRDRKSLLQRKHPSDNWLAVKRCAHLGSWSLPAEICQLTTVDEERNGYYYGLPSRPKLVARSSRDVWSHQQDGWSIGKRFRPVRYQASPSLGMTLSASSDESSPKPLEGIDWSIIDILRIGYEKNARPDALAVTTC